MLADDVLSAVQLRRRRHLARRARSPREATTSSSCTTSTRTNGCPATSCRSSLSSRTASLIDLRSKLGVISPLLTHQLGRTVVHCRRLREIVDKGAFDVVLF